MPINLTAPSVSPSAVLIADNINTAGGSPDAITQGLTRVTVNGVLQPVNAALEIQSTSAALLLPRMTTAQIAAMPSVTDGMIVYNTTTSSVNVRQSGVFTPTASNVLIATGTVNAAQIKAMFAVPFQLIPAPGAGLAILPIGGSVEYVHNTTVFNNGGNITISYPSQADRAFADVPSGILAIPVTRIISLDPAVSNAGGPAQVSNIANLGIVISNIGGNFGPAGDGSIRWYIVYSIITV